MHWLTWAFWPTTTRRFAFFSCFGGGIGGLGVAGLLWHRMNCHNPQCWRVGRYHLAGGQFVVCAKHRPGGQPTTEHIHAAHAAWLHHPPDPQVVRVTVQHNREASP
jgi:hypothetical protein